MEIDKKHMITSDQETTLNKMSLYVLWGILVFGIMGYTISKVIQKYDFNYIFSRLLIFCSIFLTANIISTFAFILIKKKKAFVKYFITTTFSLILPTFSYVSLGSNHQTWSLGFVVLIFSILHMRVDLVVYTGILLYILDSSFVYFYRDTLIPTFFNPKSELIIRFITFTMATSVAVYITKLINKTFYSIALKEKEIAEDREALQKTLNFVKDLSETLKKISNDNSDFSEKLTKSSENQASSIEQIASSTEELMSSIEEINKNAILASSEMNKIVSSANTGTQSLKKNSKEMLDLVNFSKIMIESIDSINEIAENTNLLALNAAIEAARAGDAGKGFAVVATEIRKLAEKSTQAATNVGNLLRESEIKINSSANLNNEVGLIYNEIVDKLDKISKVFQQISFATQELDKGGREISSGLEVINQASNENFELAKEIEILTKNFETEIKKLGQVIGNIKS